ncbi:Putative Defective in cullin neddylation protein [Rhizopus microsporus]|nr:Putative Defective in cullin neddylation protein [Rhizopus microsporus]
MEITQLSERESTQALKMANWSLQLAINSVFEQKRNVDVQKIKTMFNKYKDPQRPDAISVDGTMTLCEDLDIEPTQLEFLLLSHQLNSERMGEFTKEGFVKGCVDLEADNIDKLKKELETTVVNNYRTDEGFRKVYHYAFLFGRQTGQKNLALEAAIELWRLLLSDRYSLLEQWIQFLQQKHNKAISRDTWNLFLDFISQINTDLQNYNPEEAWPILIDEFVEYQKQQ